MAKKKTRASAATAEGSTDTPAVGATSPTSPVAARALSPYNQYMKANVGRLKRENPGMGHKNAFRAAAAAWGKAPENPKAGANAAAAAGVKKGGIEKVKPKNKSVDEGSTTPANAAAITASAAASATASAASAAAAELVA